MRLPRRVPRLHVTPIALISSTIISTTSGSIVRSGTGHTHVGELAGESVRVRGEEQRGSEEQPGSEESGCRGKVVAKAWLQRGSVDCRRRQCAHRQHMLARRRQHAHRQRRLPHAVAALGF